MADRPVTVSVSYPVAPGEEEEFEAWSRLRLAEAADRPGYLGGQVLAPPAPGPDWFIVHKFENERAASSWEEWFRRSPGWQQAGDIQWSVGNGTPGSGVPGSGVPGNGVPGNGVPGNGVPGNGVPGNAGPGNGQRPGQRRAAPEPPTKPAQPRPAQPTGRPPAGQGQPAAGAPRGGAQANGSRRPGGPPGQPGQPGPSGQVGQPGRTPGAQAGPSGRTPTGSPPGGVAVAARPSPPAPPSPPAAAPPIAPAPARPAFTRQPLDERFAEQPLGPSRVPHPIASIVLTTAVVVLFTAVFETAIAPMLDGGPVLLRILLLSAVISAAVAVVRPPGVRLWLENLLVPVAVRRRQEAEEAQRRERGE